MQDYHVQDYTGQLLHPNLNRNMRFSQQLFYDNMVPTIQRNLCTYQTIEIFLDIQTIV